MSGHRVTIPVRTVSALNVREHWATRSKRVKAERREGFFAFHGVKRLPLPCVVTIVRLGPRKLDDDNLRGALKGIRDGMADRLGVDDADPEVEWRYGQESSKAYAVRIVVESVDDALRVVGIGQ